MSCLQPFLVLSLAAMSRKKEKEDVDMEEEEEEEEWEEDEPWRNSKGRKTGGGTTSWARQARRAAKQAKRVVMSTGKPLEKGEEALAKGKPLEKGNKALAKGTPQKGSKALAKGQYDTKCQELKDRLMKSLNKGKLGPRLEAGTSLEKGTAASSSNAAPLEKGASRSNSAPLEKGKKKLLEKGEASGLEKGQFLEKGNVAKKVAVLESKTATNKQAKSLAKGKETAALEKGSEKKQSPEAQSEPLAVLVDWHHCLKNGPQDTVLVQDLMALQKLLDKGVEVHVLSFCGAKQVPKVEKEIWDKLPDLIDQLHWWGCCTSRTGVGGKAEYATEWGCQVAFDDSKDILQELGSWGVKTYGIQTPRESHAWMPENSRFASFAEAVRQFIRDYNL